MGETSATTISDVVSSMTGSLQTGASDIMNAVGQILPVVLPIAIAIVVITVGYKIFKRFGKG